MRNPVVIAIVVMLFERSFLCGQPSQSSQRKPHNSCYEHGFFAASYVTKSDVGIQIEPLKGSSAELAGLTPKDIVTHMNGVRMSDPKDFYEFLEDKCAGEVITLSLTGGGTLNIKLQSNASFLRTRFSTIYKFISPEKAAILSSVEVCGMTVSQVNSQLRKTFDLPASASLVVHGVGDDPSKLNGIELGDVIVGAYGYRINDIVDFIVVVAAILDESPEIGNLNIRILRGGIQNPQFSSGGSFSPVADETCRKQIKYLVESLRG